VEILVPRVTALPSGSAAAKVAKAVSTPSATKIPSIKPNFAPKTPG